MSTKEIGISRPGHVISSYIAGACGVLAGFPLDTAKTRMVRTLDCVFFIDLFIANSHIRFAAILSARYFAKGWIQGLLPGYWASIVNNFYDQELRIHLL
jgi:hypothetical protein